MSTTRRDFLTLTAAGAGLALAPRLGSLALAQADRRLRILVLGGTRFVGMHFVEAALARGHEVTMFNRGQSDPDAFKGQVTRLVGDRDPEVGDGLAALEAGEWDAVYDTSSYVPRLARAAAQLLKDRVGRYIMISTVSVYADQSRPGIHEDDAVATTPDPTVEEIRFDTYGALKALSEQQIHEAFGARATVLRPGYIVGPDDYMQTRFPLWAARIRRGGDVLAPGDPNDPVQLIDVRDIADFAIRCIEHDLGGVYNMVGPHSRLSMGDFIGGLRACTGAPITLHWIPGDWLLEREVIMVPYLQPSHPVFGGVGAVSNQRANDAGMTYRPLAVTTMDTLAHFDALPPGERAALDEALASPREAELLAEWRTQQAG